MLKKNDINRTYCHVTKLNQLFQTSIASINYDVERAVEIEIQRLD